MDCLTYLIHNSQSGSAVASLNYKDKDMTLTLSMNGQSDQKITTGTLGVKYTSKSNKMDVEGTADFAADMGSNGYIKLNDVDKLVDTAADAYIESMAKQYEAYGQKLTPSDLKQAKKELLASINPMVEKINNRWIKFAADDKENETSAEQKCITDVFTKLQNDNSMRNELTNIYKDNKFVTVKEELGVKDGSYGYVLELNEDKAKSFGKNVKESAFMKELKKCNSSFGESSVDSITDSSEEPAVKDARFELWVSQWSHQITGVNFSGKNPDDTDASMKFNMTFDYKPVTGLSLPKDAIDSKELEKEFESLMMGGSSSTSTSATTVSSSV